VLNHRASWFASLESLGQVYLRSYLKTSGLAQVERVGRFSDPATPLTRRFSSLRSDQAALYRRIHPSIISPVTIAIRLQSTPWVKRSISPSSRSPIRIRNGVGLASKLDWVNVSPCSRKLFCACVVSCTEQSVYPMRSGLTMLHMLFHPFFAVP
jgi:hypothetical protein